MALRGWHIVREGQALTLARRLPVRWDVFGEAAFPPAAPLRLAQQIRQDLWRALRHLRGFAPAVTVREANGALTVRAGGQVEGACPPATAARIAALLADPALRRRWLAHARPGGAR